VEHAIVKTETQIYPPHNPKQIKLCHINILKSAMTFIYA